MLKVNDEKVWEIMASDKGQTSLPFISTQYQRSISLQPLQPSSFFAQNFSFLSLAVSMEILCIPVYAPHHAEYDRDDLSIHDMGNRPSNRNTDHLAQASTPLSPLPFS